MAIKCENFDIIILISNIDKVYAGGFKKFKSDFIDRFKDQFQNDEFLFREGASNKVEFQDIKDKWDEHGLIEKIELDGVYKFKDFCTIENANVGPILPCDWLIFDPVTKTASYKNIK
jgi:hypothetical protein